MLWEGGLQEKFSLLIQKQTPAKISIFLQEVLDFLFRYMALWFYQISTD